MSKPARKPTRRPRKVAKSPAPAPVAAPVPASPRRRSGPVATLTAYVPPELARALRVRAAETGVSASSIIAAAVAAHLQAGA